MSFSLTDNSSDYSKWKVADLRKELKARGLNSEGKKNELIERLQLALGEGDAALLDDAATDHDDILDEDVLTDEEPLEDSELSKLESPEKEEEKEKLPVTSLKRPAPDSNNAAGNKQAKKITLNRSLVVIEKDAGKTEEKVNKDEDSDTNSTQTSEKHKVIKVGGLSEKERLERRAAKFGVAVSSDAKKEARAARFGLPTGGSKIGGIVSTNVDVLKKRAERFGTTIPGSALEKAEIEERKKKREERFGKVGNGNTPKPGEKTEVKITSNANIEEKKKLRAERFKISL